MSLTIFNDMKATDWAAWVQAVASVGAILVVGFQTRSQIASAAQLQRSVESTARTELTKSVGVLSRNACKTLVHICSELKTPSVFYEYAIGKKFIDLGGLRYIEKKIDEIPLHELPHDLISLTMMMASSVRQFNENLEFAIPHIRRIHAEECMKLIGTLNELRISAEKTLKDIEKLVPEEK